MNCILAVRSENEIKFGLRGFATAHVQKTGQAVDIESESFSYLSQNILHNK